MNSMFVRIVSAALLLVLLICSCVSCQKNPPADFSDSSAESSAETDTDLSELPFLPLVWSGNAVFRITVPDSSDSWIRKTASAVRKELSTETGVEFSMKTDFVNRMEEIDNESYEILIGQTNRSASKSAAEEPLGVYEYIIRADGNKIVLLGGSEYAVEGAGYAFLRLCDEYGNRLPKDLSVRETLGRSSYLIGVTNQKGSAVEVYDIGVGVLNSNSLIWSHSFKKYNIAGLKLRRYKGQEAVLAAYGKKFAEMVSYPEGEVLWSTSSAADNPHSVELIPVRDGGYLIAVASSNGSEVRFFDPDGSSPGTSVHAFSYPDAHGVLWDPEGDCLWVWGTNQLSKYRVERTGNGVKTVLLQAYTAPTLAGHDLAPVYGDTDLLWLSTGSTVYQFRKSTGEFSTSYSGASCVRKSAVKAVGNFQDGSVVWIIPDGEFKSWTSATVSFGKQTDSDRFAQYPVRSSDGGFYKVRVWCADYQ